MLGNAIADKHSRYSLLEASQYDGGAELKLNTGNADRRYDRFMSEMPPAGHPSAPGPAGYPAGMPPVGPWGPAGPVAPNGPARWPVFVMLLITLVAVGAAVAAWLRPLPHDPAAAPTTPAYSAQQAAESKTHVCDAFEKVWNAENVAGGRSGGDDATATLAVATSIRQVLDFGSRYLSTKLDKEPATPQDLMSAVRQLSDTYRELTLDYMDGLTNADPKLSPLLSALNQQTYTVQGLCK